RATVGALARLYTDVLQTALANLSKEIQRLVIIPDDALFRCPFAALARDGTAPPAGSRFEISILPSAAVWAHLKMAAGGRVPVPGSAALVLFAPEVGKDALQAPAFRSAGPWTVGFRLSPLRHAVEEARMLERIAGAGTLVLTGAAASESMLKKTPLGRFRIIDLITHAVVDEEQPERSAILLAPGSDREDGFLQVREIPELSLDGQLVILSSCGSSAGRILGGEGAQSLARAFLEAGAGAVLASLWPLEDSQAAALFGKISRELGRGHSVANALRVAQRSAIDRGMPPAAWAGVMVLGDGDLTPLPARRPWRWVWLLAGVALAVALGAFLLKRTP
ncbi:MAG: CHAT domain-containing protein, partial [Acidobacteria bacterium]|nr:CHAT domain-containing protein [Acidobacteriota bacterium]